jgi:hypothetical protein
LLRGGFFFWKNSVPNTLQPERVNPMGKLLSSGTQHRLRLVRRLVVAGLRAFAWLLLALVWLWSCFAVGLFRPLPMAVTLTLTLLWACLTIRLVMRLPPRRAFGCVTAGVLLIWVVWSLPPARNDRAWRPDQARLPQITIDGDRIIVKNVRCASYRSADDYDVVWDRRTFDLRRLASVDFVVAPFSESSVLAHVFVTFGFSDGEHLAVSVEARRVRGEKYSPLYGMFHRYELMYVVGDESDLIGLRANTRELPVYLYPVKASKGEVRQLFLSMLMRAERLRTAPEFYNTVTNGCSSNLLWHMNLVRKRPVAYDWRVLLPGFSDELAFDLGLIDSDGPLEEARARFCIKGRTVPWTTGKTWSRQIRVLNE